MKKMIIFLFVLAFFMCSNACQSNENDQFVYSANDSDLYTEATHSILGIRGYSRIPELGNKGNRNPYIEIVEQDAFGRKMFLYYEGFSEMSGDRYYLLISQKTDNDFVYYYSDYNFAIGNVDCSQSQNGINEQEKSVTNESQYQSLFTSDLIETLKNTNDWGKEISINKCVKQIVTRKKEDPLTYKEKNELFKEIFEGSTGRSNYYHIHYLTNDDEGKLLYLAVNPNDDDYRMVIIDGKKHYDKKITNVMAYQEELATYKREHNWKKA